MTKDNNNAAPVLQLDTLSAEIRSVWADAKAHQVNALKGYVRVGHLLDQARQQLRSDNAYGAWFRAQDFGFTTEWARRLRQLAAHEDEVLGVVATAVATTTSLPGVNRMLEILRPEPEVFADAEYQFSMAAAKLEAYLEKHTGTRTIHIPATIEEVVTYLNQQTQDSVEGLLLRVEFMSAFSRVAFKEGRPEEASEAMAATTGFIHAAWSRFDEVYPGNLGAQLADIWNRAIERAVDGEDMEQIAEWVNHSSRLTVDAWQAVNL